jgi:hypothetical protein
MLQQGDPTAQLRQWLDRLAPVVERAQAVLQCQDPASIARRSGCTRDDHGNLRLVFLGKEYLVSPQDFRVRLATDGEEPSSFISSLVLTYLANADGTPPSGQWIGFRDLPDGMFYVQAFQGYSGGRLARELKGGVQVFRRAAEALRGSPIAMGSAGYAFEVLPQVPMAVVYWDGDEDFAPQAQILFDRTTSRYMPTDGLAILGSQLVGQILKAAAGLPAGAT